MTKNEFLEKWSEDVLKRVRVIVGSKSVLAYSINCYEENGIWVISRIGERQEGTIIYEGEENFIFEKLNKIVCGKLE